MDAVTAAPAPAAGPAPAAAPTAARARAPRAGWGARLANLALALLAHAAVGASWLVTAAAVMGSIDVARRMVMNSEFAWDTGRLPQPWVIPLGLAAAWASHRFFRWSMARLGRGTPSYGPVVVAWCGALLGVGLGAYLWTPALQTGTQVGPAAGQSRPWGVLGWAAHYGRVAVPALVGLVTAVLLVASRHSPLVVGWKAASAWLRRPRQPRRAKAGPTARP